MQIRKVRTKRSTCQPLSMMQYPKEHQVQRTMHHVVLLVDYHHQPHLLPCFSARQKTYVFSLIFRMIRIARSANAQRLLERLA